MGTVKRTIINIPFNELEGIDDMFFRQIQMKKEKVMRKFVGQHESTRESFFSGVSMQGVFESFAVDRIEGESIYIGDTVISSRMLSELFADASEIVLFAGSLKGYDELEKNETDNLNVLFFDGWGTAAVEKGHVWMKERVKEICSDAGLYSSNSWSPGQHNVDIKLQKELFRLLMPEEIGITLTDSFMMHPKKSISSFAGIGENSEMQDIRACDFCSHRETCPSAYV